MLGAIRRVTLSCHDLGAMEAAYAGFLDYRLVERGRVTNAQAAAWQAPEVEGAEFIAMSPAGGDDFQFRFIAGPHQPGYVPLTTYGWNASEVMVQDVDAMAERVADSPFEIVGEPRDLSFSADIRAMQIKGPANEIVYLTQFKNPVPGLSVPEARTAVDRTFIVILGGAAMTELQDFFAERFGLLRAPVVESRVTMLSKALDVSVETLYPIAAIQLLGESLIEVDEMPAQVGPRECLPGHLPPGIAIVGFDCAEPPPDAQLSESGVKVICGVTGELIELHQH
jgi:hypothetical protein